MLPVSSKNLKIPDLSKKQHKKASACHEKMADWYTK